MSSIQQTSNPEEDINGRDIFWIGAVIIFIIVLLVWLVKGAPFPKMPKKDDGTAKAQQQLEAYKRAEEICGKENVVQKPFIRAVELRSNETVTINTDEFLCDDLKIAAMTEEERTEVRNSVLNQKAEKWCEAKDRGFDLPFIQY